MRGPIRRGDQTIWFDDSTGRLMTTTPGTEDMGNPVRCNCGRVYDTYRQPTVARYSDCDVWKCPQCGVTSDNRKWVHQPYRSLR